MLVIKSRSSTLLNLLTKVSANFCVEGSSREFSKCSSLQTKWHLMSAVIVERSPVITQKKTKIEENFSAMMLAIEKEKSLLSDHGLRHIEDRKNSEKKKQLEHMDVDGDAVLHTAQELEDMWKGEHAAFQFGPRITEADETNDQKSLERKLDRKLVLLLRQQLGKDTQWACPMNLRKDNESMKETAERALTELCGPQFKAEIFGNAPCGFYQFKYPLNAYADFVGAKVFFFKAHYADGSLDTQCPDYRWVTREEVRQFTANAYGSKLKNLILE